MFTRITAVVLLVFISMQSYADTKNEYFNDGIAAFKQHRFSDAITHFNKAKQAGVSGSHIEYNIGVTYYKLGKYEQAKEYFLLVAKDDKYSQVAHYNLGLISRRLKDFTKALYWFKKASAKKGQNAISKLANKMIKKVSSEVDPATIRRIAASIETPAEDQNNLMPVNSRRMYSGLKDSISRKASNQSSASSYNDPATSDEVSRGSADEVEVIQVPRGKAAPKKGKPRGGIQFAIGTDDNVDFVATDNTTALDDTYTEIFGYVSVPFATNWKALANFYTQRFSDADQDYRSFTGGVNYRHRVGSWWLTPQVDFTTSSLASDSYQKVTNYALTGTKKVGAGKWLIIRYRYSDISSENTLYSYEEGSRNQFRVSYYTRVAFGKLRFQYQFENNDRDDNLAASTVTSASPTRHDFKVKLTRKFADNWTWGGELGFRTSEYELVSGQASPARDDDRFRASLDLTRKMNKQWRIGAAYKFTDNDSNLAASIYEKNDFQIYTLWTF